MTTPKCTRPWCHASAGALAVAPSRTALKVKAALIRLMIAPSVSSNTRMLAKTPWCRGNELSQIVTPATREAAFHMNARKAQRITGISIDLGPGALHDFGPLRRIPADHLRELLRSSARRLVADLAEPRLEHGRDDRLVDRGIQLVDDGPRHSRRSDHSAPGRRVVARDSRLRDRRQVRKAR